MRRQPCALPEDAAEWQRDRPASPAPQVKRLDHTSHTGRPGPDELVPSRYALLIGEIDVLVVSDGVLTLPGAMLAHNAEPAVREAWLADNFLPPDAFDWALDPRRREFQLDIGRNRRE